MNPVKKILTVHSDAVLRRRLTLLLAGLGCDQRTCGDGPAALALLRAEWFDLAILDAGLAGGRDLEFAAALRKIQPTLPVLLAVPRLELPQVIEAIRLGVSDVAAPATDWPGFLNHVRELLRVHAPAPGSDEPTAEELAAVEAVLARVSAETAATAAEPRHELVQLARENTGLTEKLERLAREKTALEAELRALLAQTADGARLETELAAAAQAAIDEKARSLAADRAALGRERRQLEELRNEGAAPAAAAGDERTLLAAWREELQEEDQRLRAATIQVQQENVQLAQERRRWHEDLDLLRAQEASLRAYEERLRGLLAQAEAERVSRQAAAPAGAPVAEEAGLQEAWAKVRRATELLEAEQRNFREDRLALREQNAALNQREAKLKAAEARLAEWEGRLKTAALPPPAAVTRTPFDMARSIWNRKN